MASIIVTLGLMSIAGCNVEPDVGKIEMKESLTERIYVCAKHDVDSFCNHKLTHILSIEDPGTIKKTPSWFKGKHLQVCFSDVENQKQAREYKGTAATESQVESILEFGKEALQEFESKLLVHCYAGASRSTAATLSIITDKLGVGTEKKALDLLLKIRPEAFPNILVVNHADKLLKRNGKLRESLNPLRKMASDAVDEWINVMRNQS